MAIIENDGLLGSDGGLRISMSSFGKAGLIRGERWYNTFISHFLLIQSI